MSSFVKQVLAAAALVAGVSAQASNVAIVTGGFYTPDLNTQLTAQGHTVTEISSYDATSLAAFDSVVHYGNSFTDTAALETFVTNGGRLVLTPWAGRNFTVPSTLAIFTEDLNSPDFSVAYPGVTVSLPADPLLAGVTFPAGAGGFNIGRINGISFAGGATQIASWSDGVALLGYKTLGTGSVVGLNMHVITSDTAYQVINQPWAATLASNAVTVSAVPEPETYALALAGLCVAGVVARRRNVVA